jgi:hypothetical protein
MYVYVFRYMTVNPVFEPEPSESSRGCHRLPRRFRTHRMVLPRGSSPNSSALAAAYGHYKLAHVVKNNN